MKKDDVHYDSRQPLETCDWGELNRQIGVRVSDPYFHRGLGREMVDVEYEFPTTNTNCYGRVVDLDRISAEAVDATELILEKLELVIKDLQGHYDRLMAEFHSLSQNGIPRGEEEA